MDGAAEYLYNLLITWQNGLIVGSAWSLTQILSKSWPKVFNSITAKRLKPLAAIIWCSIFLWVPELSPNDIGTGSKILLGIILGSVVGHAHKIIKHTIFGKIFPDDDNKRHDKETRKLVDEFLKELRDQGKIKDPQPKEDDKIKQLSKYLEKFLT